MAKYQPHDLITFNRNQTIGLVLQVQEDSLRVLSDKNEIKYLKYPDISKKIPFDRKASCMDKECNEIIFDIPVKCIHGQF
jgi:hypothetical protein